MEYTIVYKKDAEHRNGGFFIAAGKRDFSKMEQKMIDGYITNFEQYSSRKDYEDRCSELQVHMEVYDADGLFGNLKYSKLLQ